MSTLPFFTTLVVSPERDLGRKAIETEPLPRSEDGPRHLCPERDLGRKAIETQHGRVLDVSEGRVGAPKGTLAERLLRQKRGVSALPPFLSILPRKGPWPKGY